MKKTQWTEVGVIGVDAGICWIGDPCYILHRDPTEKTRAEIGENWSEFCGMLQATVTQFNYALGHPGLGVVVETGYGDGVYPVYVRYNKEGRVVAVRVEFDEEEEAAP